VFFYIPLKINSWATGRKTAFLPCLDHRALAKEAYLTDRAVVPFLTATELAQQEKSAGEQSWAAGKGQTWQAGSC